MWAVMQWLVAADSIARLQGGRMGFCNNPFQYVAGGNTGCSACGVSQGTRHRVRQQQNHKQSCKKGIVGSRIFSTREIFSQGTEASL